MTAFADEVGKRFSPSRPASFWTCEPLFRHLLDPEVAAMVVNGALRALADDSAADVADGQAMRVAEGPGWRLRLHLLLQSRRYLHSTVRDTLVAPVNGLPLRFDLYTLPDGFDDAVFDPAHKLGRAGSGIVAAGELLALHANVSVADFRIEQPLLVLIFETAPRATLEWRFSKDTLHAWQHADADPVATDLMAAAWLAGRLAHQTSLKPLKALAAHPHPGVRAAVLDNIGRLSRSVARALLTEAADDPHPLVQRAARQALERQDSALGPTGGRRWR